MSGKDKASGFRKGLQFGRAAKAAKKPAAKKKPKPVQVVEEKTTVRKAAKKSVPVMRQPAVAGDRLQSLLKQASALFGGTSSEKKLLFTLGWKKNWWHFEVVNAWQLWFEKGLAHEFRAANPCDAVAAFLKYVKSQQIDCASLTLPD